MKSYILSFWSFMDPIYFYFSRLSYLPCENNILRVRVTRYKGKNIVLSDGTQIKRNDLLVKIHLHNAKLLKELKDIKSELLRGKRIYRLVQRSLPELDTFVRTHTHANEIKGIIGITMLNKGCSRLGFEVVSISHPIYKWFKWLAFLPIELLSSQSAMNTSTLLEHKPNYLLMSKNTLSKLYRQ
jgi:hypothetical protein